MESFITPPQVLTQLASRLLPDDGGSVLPIIATVMFVAFFVVMFLFVFTDRRRSHHRRMESLILDDDAPDPWHPDRGSSTKGGPPKPD